HAAQFGMAYCFAHFINQDAGTAPLDLYRRNFKPSRSLTSPYGSIGVSVTVGETEDDAHRLAAPRNLWVLQLLQNRAGAFPSIEEALAYDFSHEEKVMLKAVEKRGIVGTPEQVRGR